MVIYEMRKTTTTISIDPELLHLAKVKGVVISHVVGTFLREYLSKNDDNDEKKAKLEAEIKNLQAKTAIKKAILAEITQKMTEKRQKKSKKEKKRELLRKIQEGEKEEARVRGLTGRY